VRSSCRQPRTRSEGSDQGEGARHTGGWRSHATDERRNFRTSCCLLRPRREHGRVCGGVEGTQQGGAMEGGAYAGAVGS
jgi:hypothetical protein